MTNYTYEDIANDFNLWAEYIDPDATISEEEFNNMTTEEKLNFKKKYMGELILQTAKDGNLNERFVAFMLITQCNKTGAAKNAEYMCWVSNMKQQYCKSEHIVDHEDFTRFIINNGVVNDISTSIDESSGNQSTIQRRTSGNII